MSAIGALVLLILALGSMTSLYLLGFRLGGDYWASELRRVQEEAARAERALHDMTRRAFVSMAEEVERRNGRNDTVAPDLRRFGQQ